MSFQRVLQELEPFPSAGAWTSSLWDELLFKFKHHILKNHRAAFSDNFLLEALKALLVTHPEIETPVQLFNHLELQTIYSPLTSPSSKATAKQQQQSRESGPPPYEQNSPTSFSTQKTSEQAFNPNSVPCIPGLL